MTLTDREGVDEVLDNLREICLANQVEDCIVYGLSWGEISEESMAVFRGESNHISLANVLFPACLQFPSRCLFCRTAESKCCLAGGRDVASRGVLSTKVLLQ